MIKESFMEEPKFMFRLTTKEWILMRSQTVISSVQPIDYEENMPMRSEFVTSSAESADFQEDVTQKPQNETQSQKKRKIHITPFAFTEHGVTMVANVLKSDRAVQMSIAIVRTF